MDTSAVTGVGLGLLAALMMGLFMAPRRYYRGESRRFLFGASFGAALTALCYWLLSGLPFSVGPMAAVPFAAGVFWTLGTYAYAAGAHRVGLAKAAGIKNTHLVVTTAGGFLLFGEAGNTDVILASLGAALMILTAVVLAKTRHNDAKLPHASRAGYLIAVGAPLSYGTIGLLLKWVIAAGLPKPQILFAQALGALIVNICVTTGAAARRRPKAPLPLKQHALALLAGAVWAAGFIAAIFAIAHVGVAVARALQALAIVVSFLYGAIFFGEIDLWKYRFRTAAVLLLTALSILCLYLAKTVG